MTPKHWVEEVCGKGLVHLAAKDRNFSWVYLKVVKTTEVSRKVLWVTAP